jgi:peptidoglycan lytic transglycosylase
MKTTFLGLALFLSLLLSFGCASVPHGRLAADLAHVGAEPAAPSAVARAVSAAQIGIASFYHSALVGRLTANGERYDERALTAAHRTLDLGTRVRVTNLENRKSVVVTVNDRGPYAKGRIIDLSRRAARVLGFVHDGVTRVKVEPLT